MTSSKFDDLLVRLGTARWNYFYFIVICWFCFLHPGQVISIVFAAPSVSFTCKVPEEEEHDLVPDQDLSDACTYLINSTSPEGFELETKPCLEWVFENSTYSRTLTSEYRLVCGRKFLRTAYHSLFMLGNLFGVGAGEVEGVIGKYGVPGENESGERLLDYVWLNKRW
ncbi:organic cation transporter-like protein [Palaemon carinicauda]|uniref:organic cation transporter-like protein n=1 Tax=Palaemon carinicauda TaxID=392227 RepID=UPI0035B5758C